MDEDFGLEDEQLKQLARSAAETLAPTGDGGFRATATIPSCQGNAFIWGSAILLVMALANVAYTMQFGEERFLGPGDKLKFDVFRPLPTCGGKIEFGLAIRRVQRRTCYVTYEIRCGRSVFVHGEMNLLIQTDE
jgi:hypothetical protein